MTEKESKVKQRITATGYYYRCGEVELGPYLLEDEQAHDFDDVLARKLGVDVKDVLASRLREIVRPTSFQELMWRSIV